MFCTKCGAQFADGSAFCPTCGNPVNAAPQQPVQPQYQQPAYQQPVYQQPANQVAPAGTLDLKKIWHMVIAGVAAFALLIGILNLFSILDMPLTASMGGESNSEYGSVSKIADLYDEADSSFAMGYIANIIFGLANLAIAAVGALYFLKIAQNKPFYDQYIGKNLKGFTPGFAMGVVGAAAAVIQFILLLFTSLEETVEYPFYGKITMEMSVSVPWLTWVALVIFAGLAAVDYFVVNKKN